MRKSILAMAFGIVTCTVASASESCPAVTKISGNGVYTVQTNNGHDWMGIAPAGSGGQVKKFAAAIFYPEKDGNPNRGTLGKCSYDLEKGVVDLRYKPDAKPEPAVRLNDFNAWHQKDGPFGMVYYECESDEPTRCKFDVIQ